MTTLEEYQAEADRQNTALGEGAPIKVKVFPITKYALIAIKSADEAAWNDLDAAGKLAYYKTWIAGITKNGIPVLGDGGLNAGQP